MLKLSRLLLLFLVACNDSSEDIMHNSSTNIPTLPTTYTWTKEDQSLFIAGCMGTAKGLVGQAKAEHYCDCMLNQFQKKFRDMESSMHAQFDSNELGNMVENCR